MVVVAAAAAAAAVQMRAETALLQQQKLQQLQTDSDRQNKQRTASLMALALSTTDPARQMDLYNQVVQLDPANAPAVQGIKMRRPSCKRCKVRRSSSRAMRCEGSTTR